MAFQQLAEFCPECAQFAIDNEIPEFFLGGAFGLLLDLGLGIIFLFILGLYIYSSFAWMTIARKLKYKNDWFAWIPFVRTAMILQLGRFHWAWIFLIFIPIAGWLALFILAIIATWRIYKIRKYPGWFSLAPIIPKIGFILHMIVLGFVAWKDKNVRVPRKRSSSRRSSKRSPSRSRKVRRKRR